VIPCLISEKIPSRAENNSKCRERILAPFILRGFTPKIFYKIAKSIPVRKKNA
jgi:hypothetical protein